MFYSILALFFPSPHYTDSTGNYRRATDLLDRHLLTVIESQCLFNLSLRQWRPPFFSPTSPSSTKTVLLMLDDVVTLELANGHQGRRGLLADRQIFGPVGLGQSEGLRPFGVEVPDLVLAVVRESLQEGLHEFVVFRHDHLKSPH